jgi:signal transduction histidine kinase/CheY-like chemotaxis protein
VIPALSEAWRLLVSAWPWAAALVIALVLGWWWPRSRRVQASRGRIDELLQELALRRAELREIEAERSRFLAAFSHDLKQPMQAINLYLGSMEDSLVHARMEDAERSRSTESLLRLKQGVAYMNDVFDSMLDVSRLESGALEVGIERVPAATFCERVLQQHRRMADDLGLQLQLRADGMEQAMLQTDPRLLERILRNFISNAMRYTRQGGIRLRIATRGSLCRIAIVDTGTGISAAMRKKIFDEFTRGDAAAMASQGVGLGLSIARRLAARIGARITLRSHVGVGSVFAIELPLSVAPLSDAERISLRDARILHQVLTQVVVEAPPHTLMVCIDSDPDVVHALQLLAPGLGVQVLAAGASGDAIQQLAALGRVPGLLLVDAQLQSEPALQAITRLNDEFNAEIPVILCSDEQMLPDVGLQAGSRVTPLQRPFSAETLRDAIQRSLSALP